MVKTMPWWLESWTTIQGEFSDLPDVTEVTRLCLRLLIAVVLGGILGYERERTGAAAGFRTHMLVALGSALFVLVPLQAGTDIADMSRVLQGVIAGIGFLGAGAILKSSDDQSVRGLTTAASIWLTAAVGIAAGMGREATAVLSTVFALLILLALRIPVRRAGRKETGMAESETLIKKETDQNQQGN
jgi:putative Mg2+ transporter-C (MgtC) family protein